MYSRSKTETPPLKGGGGYPDPPGSGLSVGLTMSARKKSIVSKPHDKPRIKDHSRRIAVAQTTGHELGYMECNIFI